MTKPVNIYALSRIHEEGPFNIVNRHRSRREGAPRTKIHEIESLRLLADGLYRLGIGAGEMDGFFFGFHIPLIGKEFDLLRFTDTACLNIELKSAAVPEEQILAQLLKNRYYLSHLEKRQYLFTVVTAGMACYTLTPERKLRRVGAEEIAEIVRQTADGCLDDIDSLFSASRYLVSPHNTPDRFISGAYFLTQAQETIKRDMLEIIGRSQLGTFFHLTGKPGTGKTLLLYDLAKTLSDIGQTVIVHGGWLSPGQVKISQAIPGLTVIPAARLTEESIFLTQYRFILVDESHRISISEFEILCRSVRDNGQVCIFSSDPEQVLTTTEKERNIVGAIRALPPAGEYVLSEKLRANRELQEFIACMKDLGRRPEQSTAFANVQLNYANTSAEAQELLDYYRGRGFVFISYTAAARGEDPFADYREDFDAHHVIGQEFDRVVMLMDSSFYYGEDGTLQGIPHPNPDYLYPNLFYQGVTRVREQLAIIVVQAEELFEKIVSIVE